MTIHFDDLEKLIAIAERGDINVLEVVDGSVRINIVCHPDAQPSLNPDILTSSLTSNNKPPTNSQQYASDKPENALSAVIGATGTTAEQSTLAAVTTSILAPMLGTFYLRPNPDADEFVQVGDQVVAGATLCVVEAMKIMHEVKAPSDCMIDEVLVTEGEVVEYDQPLFMVSPL